MITNAVVTDTSIIFDQDHNCMTINLVLEGYNWGAGFGDRIVGAVSERDGKKVYSGTPYGVIGMMKIMDVCGVDKWEKIPGCYIRVMSEGWGKPITTIGHIIKNKWFSWDDLFRKKENEDGEKDDSGSGNVGDNDSDDDSDGDNNQEDDDDGDGSEEEYLLS